MVETEHVVCDPLELAAKRPEWSAKAPLTSAQKYAALALLALVAGSLVLAPLAAGRVLIGLATLFYLVSIGYRIALVLASARPDASFSFTPGELAAPRDWPVYSILVPMYGVENYIARCAESLFAQTYPAIEFIFVDDGGTDRTVEVQGLLPRYEADRAGALVQVALPPLRAPVRVSETLLQLLHVEIAEMEQI